MHQELFSVLKSEINCSGTTRVIENGGTGRSNLTAGTMHQVFLFLLI